MPESFAHDLIGTPASSSKVVCVSEVMEPDAGRSFGAPSHGLGLLVFLLEGLHDQPTDAGDQRREYEQHERSYPGGVPQRGQHVLAEDTVLRVGCVEQPGAEAKVSHGGFLDQHIKVIRSTYHERRDVMLAAIDSYFPGSVDWTQPQGGLFLWGIMPENLDSTEVLKTAIEHKVAFVPGGSFHPNGGGNNTMRLNFSNATPEKIQEGIFRLGKVLQEHIKPGG